MVASNRLDDHPTHLIPIGDTGKSVLRSAVIYGANAAGKSNLVKAMAFAQSIIKDGEKSTLKRDFLQFRFLDRFDSAPTSFEFRFLIKDCVFIYGFDISGKLEIEAEWLATQKGDDEVTLFERTSEGKATVGKSFSKLFPTDKISLKTLRILTNLPLRSDQLLLNRIQDLPLESQGQTILSIINWLTQNLVVLRPDYRMNNINDILAGNEKLKCLAEGFLNRVGTGVGGLTFHEIEREASLYNGFLEEGRRHFYDLDYRLKEDDPNMVIVRVLFSTHSTQTGGCVLPFAEESDGTQQLLHLLPVLAGPANGEKVIVIDELDRSLHPLICWEFIRFFSESAPSAHKQLIVTTHEAHLLNQDLLRRDEYWFVEKDEQQQSRMVSLCDFKVRNDFQVEKGYLQGRFGAIPMIGGMADLEKLIETPAQGETEHAS